MSSNESEYSHDEMVRKNPWGLLNIMWEGGLVQMSRKS